MVGAGVHDAQGMGTAVAQDLERTNDQFSDLQQDLKDQALSHGYPGHVEPAWSPLVDFYVKTWVPQLLEWQRFYAANKSWNGQPWDWKHADEVTHYKAALSQARRAYESLRPGGVPGPTSPSHGASPPGERTVSEVYLEHVVGPPLRQLDPRPPPGILGLPIPVVVAGVVGSGLVVGALFSLGRKR